MDVQPNRPLLMRAGFQAFLWTQFLGALNDNLFKYIVAFMAYGIVGDANMPLAGAIFILPFLLFSGYAGQAADLFSKRSVLIVTKSMEIFTMSLALYAFWIGSAVLGLAVLFLMALQSTLFSPAKYGILPEALDERYLSDANGWLEMSTFLAIILGSALSGTMFDLWEHSLYVVGFILLAIAVLGTSVSFGIPRVAPSGAKEPFRFNPWGEIAVGVRHLYADRPLWRTTIGITYFWFLGAVIQMLIFPIAVNDLGVGNKEVGYLMMFLSMGIGIGSVAAGRLSGERVELGLIPFGSIGMGGFALLLSGATHSFVNASILLGALGFCGGLFIVPLNAYLQKASGGEEKGRSIAACNVVSMVGVLAASGVYWLFVNLLGLGAAFTVALLGILTLGVTVYIARLLPYAAVRIVLKLATQSIFKISIVGKENIPKTGSVLFVSNHMSFADGCLVGACVPRYMRFLVYKALFNRKGIRRLLGWLDAIPVSSESRRDIVNMLRQARESLDAGDAVCIFAEGAISRTGNLLPFQRGFEKIVEGTGTPIVPVHLDGLWGSVFSFDGGRFFWKWPKRFRYPVTVSFGEPIASDASSDLVRQKILELGCEAAINRPTKRDTLPERFIRQAKRSWFSFCIADTTGKSLTYGKTLAASLQLSRWMRRNTNGDAIGLMLPGSVGGALANIGAALSGKAAVNLNFTAGREGILSAVRQCEIQTVLTTRAVLTRMGLEDLPGTVLLEDVVGQIPRWKIALTWLGAFLTPAALLRRIAAAERPAPGDLAAVLFSSGSSGEPKGVMLSHYNILSNCDAVAQLLGPWENNRVCGILPFFHSFGLTATLWLPLVKGFGADYHPNPLDARRIGELCKETRPGLLLTTPTFCKGMIRKCDPDSFSSIHHFVTGAERLPDPLANEFRERFGVELFEGYGCTELAPVVAVNTHDFDDGDIRQMGGKRGTVGHSLPGVAVRVVHPETGEPLPPNAEGLLLVRGANVMMGYWKQPELTEDAFVDGWYNTGDIACVDEDGFVAIADRLSRFSKIGGEMVPHVKIEEAILAILTEGACAVASVPDEAKGERLAVLLANASVSAVEIWNRLKRNGLPPLWIPKPADFFSVDEIPVLGTGKRDLRRIQAVAREMAG